MKRYKSIAAVLLFASLALLAAHRVRADVPRALPFEADPLQEVLDRIRSHAETGAWERPDWKDERIEAWLEQLVATIAKGAELEGVQLPVRQADVAPLGDARFPLRENLLLVGKDVKHATTLRRSIVLADGNADIGSIEDCVVVARGAVSLRISKRSVIVAGIGVDGQIDGDVGAAAATGGSVIVTPGWANIRSGYGTVLLALESGVVTMPRDMVFVNCEVPPVRLPFANANTTRSVKIADVPLHPLVLHPLSAKLELQGIVQAEPLAADPFGRLGSTAKGVVFRFEGRRYVADVGEPIVDEAGQTIEALAGWRLVSVSGHVAIFAKADTLAAARMAPK